MSHTPAQSASPATGVSPARRPLRRPLPTTWWLHRRTYFLFMVREFTSLFVAAYAVLWIVLVASAPVTFQAILMSRWTAALHLPALLMVLYHTYTWFQATPQVMPIWRGEKRVDPRWISGAHWAVWIVVTLTMVAAVVWAAGEKFTPAGG